MLKFIFNEQKSGIWKMILIIILTSISAISCQVVYRFIGYVIDFGLNYKGDEYTGLFGFVFNGKFGQMGSLKLTITLSIGVVLFGLVCYVLSYISSIIQTKTQNSLANVIRKKLYYKLKGKKLPYPPADFLVIMQEDIYQPASIMISVIPGLVGSLVTSSFCLYMLNSINPLLLITPIALSPVLVWVSIKYNKATYKQNKIFRQADGELKQVVDNTLFTNDEKQLKKFEKTNEKYKDIRKEYSNYSNRYSMWLNVIKILIYIISCTIAGMLAIKGRIMLGEYLVFVAFINSIFNTIINFVNYVISFISAKPRIEKVKNMMEGDYDKQ